MLFTVSETFVIVTPPFLLATWWIRPRGSAFDISVANSLTPASLRLSMLCGFVVLSSPSPSAMLGFAIYQGTTRPGRRPIMDKVTGCTLCQANGPPPCSILSSAGVSKNQRLGFNAQGAGEPCGRTPPGGKRCNHVLDPLGRHAGLCSKGLYTRRHDRVRDHLALVARQAGLTAQVEQNVFVPGQTLDDGEPAPGIVRPIHRADLRIIEPEGSELWLDVRIRTVAPGQPIARELLREEQTKCRTYGQRHG